MQGNTIPTSSVLDMLTTLSDENKLWIADRLYEQVGAEKGCELDKAIEEAHSGKLYHADTVEQLMADLMK